MTSESDPPPPARTTLRAMFSARMLVALLMGFASGLPLLLTGSLLQARMTDAGIDLGTIGLFALVGLPYSFKFVWAPLIDRYTLTPALGRRRGWLLAAQLALILAIVALGFTPPGASVLGAALAALAVSFCSASQDTVIDAYRRESLSDAEQGLGAALYVNGYRVGMLVASGGGLILADFLPYSVVYLLMAAAMLVGVITTLRAAEPAVAAGAPQSLAEAVVEPFLDYFVRPDAVAILAFILLYKIGDTMASQMTTPFYLDIGFSKAEIGTVVKLFGFWATVGGSLLGGALMLRLGSYRSLWLFGVLQAVSTAGFALLAQFGARIELLAGVIAFENLSGGMGTAAFIGFMAALTNRRFTATQYALLTSFMALPRTLITATTGYLADALGWSNFFIACALLALPGLLLLVRFQPWLQRNDATVAAGIA